MSELPDRTEARLVVLALLRRMDAKLDLLIELLESDRLDRASQSAILAFSDERPS